MIPEEKAKELMTWFMQRKVYVAIRTSKGSYREYHEHMARRSARTMALKCVNEIIKLNPHKVDYVGDRIDPLVYEKVFTNTYQYWQDVKKELENL